MLHRNEVQPCCLNMEVRGESLVLQPACSPWLVEELETDRGLQVFSRLPEREHRRLLNIARRPENICSLAPYSTLTGTTHMQWPTDREKPLQSIIAVVRVRRYMRSWLSPHARVINRSEEMREGEHHRIPFDKKEEMREWYP